MARTGGHGVSTRHQPLYPHRCSTEGSKKTLLPRLGAVGSGGPAVLQQGSWGLLFPPPLAHPSPRQSLTSSSKDMEHPVSGAHKCTQRPVAAQAGFCCPRTLVRVLRGWPPGSGWPASRCHPRSGSAHPGTQSVLRKHLVSRESLADGQERRPHPVPPPAPPRAPES